MRSVFPCRSLLTLGVAMLFVLPLQSFPQESPLILDSAEKTLPSAPLPASLLQSDGSDGVQTPANQQTSTSQTPGDQQPATDKSQHDLAEEQLKAQEKQRVMGVMATFNTTTNRDAVPLSPKQKFRLFFKSSTDPWPFLLAGAVAGIGQASDSNPEWGQGAEGYAKRYGSAYSDAFIGNFFGNAVLPSLLHEDPRFFQMGKGAPAKRFLWAAASAFWCRRDNGTWGPNYSNVGGNFIGAAISRAYYPPSQRTFGDVVEDGLTVSVEGIVGAEIIEFWPDLVHRYKKNKAVPQSNTLGLSADESQTKSK